MFWYKTHRIGDIILENASSYNLDITPEVGVADSIKVESSGL